MPLLLLLVTVVSSISFGEWKDLPKTLGWSVFNSANQPFDPARNLEYCSRATINVRHQANVDFSSSINDALKKLRATGGGTVKLDPGIYLVTTHIRMPSYTCLVGSGMKDTIIRLRDNSPKWANSGVVRSRHTERITISDLTIDGNKDRQLSTNIFGGAYGRFGFYSELTNYVYLRRVAAINNRGYGFDPHGSKKYWAYYLLLEDCYARNNSLDGFTLDQTVYVSLLNSETKANSRHGVNIVTGTRYCRIHNVLSSDNGFDSRIGCNMMVQNNQAFGTRHVHVARSTLYNAKKAGMCMNNVTDVAFDRNTVDNPQNFGFCYHLVSTRGATLRASTCKVTKEKRVLRVARNAIYKFYPAGDIGETRLSPRTRSFPE